MNTSAGGTGAVGATPKKNDITVEAFMDAWKRRCDEPYGSPLYPPKDDPLSEPKPIGYLLLLG